MGTDWITVIPGSDVNLATIEGGRRCTEAANISDDGFIDGAGANVGAEAHASGGTPLAVRLFW